MSFGLLRHRQRGISLIELMIGLVLGLIVMAAFFQIYLANRRSYVLADALSARQEAVRYVTTVLSKDVRMAGYRGCLPDNGEILNTVNPDPADPDNERTLFTHADFRYRFEQYVEGFDADGEDWAPALPDALTDVWPRTDVLTLRMTLDPEVYVVRAPPGHGVNSALLTNPRTPTPFADGDIVMVTDCTGATIFQITNYNLANPGNPAAAVGTIVHNTGQGAGLPSPGNHQQSLGRVYPVGSQVMRIDTVSYFIRASDRGTGPALWRRTEGDDPAERELAEGVENLQVLYGVDTDGNRTPDQYQTAAQVGDSGNWGRVVTVRVALLVAGVRDRAADRDPRQFDLLDTRVGPFDDGRLRRVVTLTLSLRNRLP